MKVVAVLTQLYIVIAKGFCNETDSFPNGKLTLGYLVPWQGWPVGPSVGSAIILGINEIEKRQLLPGYEIEWLLRNDACEARRGMHKAVQIWHSVEKLDAIIGSGCSVVCQPLSLLAAAWGIPIISWGCSSLSLSDKTSYPTFTRALGTNLGRIPPMASVAEKLEWNRICIISTPEPIYKLQAEELFKEFQHQGKYVHLFIVESTVRGKEILDEKLEILRTVFSSVRNKVTFFVLMGYAIDLRNMLICAYDVEMLNGQYAFLTIESQINSIVNKSQVFRSEMDAIIYEGLMAIGITRPSGEAWDHFRQDVIDAFQDPRFDHLPHLPPDASIGQVNTYAGKASRNKCLVSHLSPCIFQDFRKIIH